MTQDRIKNGMIVTDVITNFTGCVTGLVHYITGCDQALVTRFIDQSKTSKQTQEEQRWIDVDRLKVLQDKTITLPGHEKATSERKNVGFDTAPPMR